jgi:hypothetical protein
MLRCMLTQGVVEWLGYIVRIVSIQQKPRYLLAPYITSLAAILVAPSLFAASIYMSLGRTIRLLQGEHHSLMRSTWLTKIYVVGDIIAFVVQGIGAIVISSLKEGAISRGSRIITIGLVVQLVFFGWFIVSSAVFHWRTNRHPTDRSRNPSEYPLKQNFPG